MTAPAHLGTLPDHECLEVPAAIFSLYRLPAFPLFDEWGARLHIQESASRASRTALMLREDAPALRRYLRAHLHRIAVSESIPAADRAWAVLRLAVYEAADLLAHLEEDVPPSGIVAALTEATHFLRRSRRHAALLLQALAEADPAPPVHMTRTAMYALMLGSAAGMKRSDHLAALAAGAAFADAPAHDEPAHLLLEPPAEGHPLRAHPERAVALMHRIGLTDPGSIAAGLSHHERFDGRGYPDRLAGGAIPFEARCVAIASDFALRTAVAPGAAAGDTYAALEAMTADTGRYDPDLLRVFIRLVATPSPTRDRLAS